MVIIHVTGFPRTAEMPKLIHIVRQILKDAKVKNFWIKELADMRDVDLKEARIEISTYENANKAVRKLDNYYFLENNICSVLSARIEEEEGSHARSPGPYRSKRLRYSRSRSRSYSRYSPKYYSPFRDRSRSPLFSDTSKLDLEIELLRKQRLVIEEERKLLMERKKLEMIREYGVSASRELENMERSRDRRARPQREERRRRERTPPPPPPRRPRPEGIPQFVKPCLHILKQMKPIILAKVKLGEKTSLDHLIRTQLRRRLAVALENKSYLPAENVVELYRKKYPVETDEAMITKCLDDLRSSLWPISKTGISAKKKGDQIKRPDKETQVKAKDEPGTSAIPDVNIKSESTEKELIVPNKMVKVESHTDVQEVIETSEATVEQMLASADGDWIENGIDWDDDDEDESEEAPEKQAETQQE